MESSSTKDEQSIPIGCPRFKPKAAFDDAVGVVTVHRTLAWEVNQNTKFLKRNIQAPESSDDGSNAAGCHFLLPCKTKDPFYQFGRSSTKGRRESLLDVYIPDTRVAMKQFTLFPDHNVNYWRIEANSETITRVNGVPLQVVDTRTKTYKTRLPHLLYLDPMVPNQVMVGDLEITVWLLKTPRDALGPNPSLAMSPIHSQVQDIVNHPENWAQARWILGKHPIEISTASERVLERFTGTVYTAKLFRDNNSGRDIRDREFRNMNKQLKDESIVQYLYATEIRGIPSIITSTHEGFAPYAVCHGSISSWHPGTRFQVATNLLRRLFTAVDFLHFNSIIHGALSRNSVLLRLNDAELEQVLVVDYGDTRTVAPGQALPREDMIEDGRASMELVDECCDIWAFRNGPPPEAMSDEEMAHRTRKAANDYEKVRKVNAQFFQNKKGDPQSAYGKKLARLLDKMKYGLEHAQSEQVFNSQRRVILPLTAKKIQEIVQEWESGHRASGVEPPMILSLGHQFLDGLIDQLRHRNWDVTPRDVCHKLKMLEGDCKEHWRPLLISKRFSFPLRPSNKSGNQRVLVCEESFADYLAFYMQLRPECNHAVYSAYQEHIKLSAMGTVWLKDIENFSAALQQSGSIPLNILTTLRKLSRATLNDELSVEEQFEIWTHVPSRAFNLTQLQNLANSTSFKNCICNDVVPCENFAEVRGGAEVQGCYAPLSLLHAFAEAFDLTACNSSQGVISYPIHDPSDFYQVNNEGRLILARRGLVGYASICRTGDQITHCPKDVTDIHTAATFLPTYFGDLIVLPPSPDKSFNVPRPAHWSLFKPAKPSSLEFKYVEPDTTIGKMLAQRQKLREEAVPPPSKQSASGGPPPSKRDKRQNSLNPGLSRLGAAAPFPKISSLGQRLNLDPVQQSFTEVASSVGLQDAKVDVDKMLANLSNIGNGSTTIHPLFNFKVHGQPPSSPTERVPSEDGQSGSAEFAVDPSFPKTSRQRFSDDEQQPSLSVQPRLSLPDTVAQSSSHDDDDISMPDTEPQEWEYIENVGPCEADTVFQTPSHGHDENTSMPDTEEQDWDHLEDIETGEPVSDVAEEVIPSSDDLMSDG
ncbi:hypothetical protein BDV96DRAFT_649304 [Lophiotrema nucula]|uniref:Protein kinase domain-containing protein n=1 Tax=Lophiotrema nucula TaxID=690887 RepID=A0A6A5YYH1_9PLEO|nr:hypothetical protein BDV96DRAFT_649304 [Lophiotrema nucula]